LVSSVKVSTAKISAIAAAASRRDDAEHALPVAT
jgi:hypothetical protein